MLNFLIHNSQSCVPSSEGCLLVRIASRWFTGCLLAGCFVKFFYGLLPWEKWHPVGIIYSFRWRGVFIIRAIGGFSVKNQRHLISVLAIIAILIFVFVSSFELKKISSFDRSFKELKTKQTAMKRNLEWKVCVTCNLPFNWRKNGD